MAIMSLLLDWRAWDSLEKLVAVAADLVPRNAPSLSREWGPNSSCLSAGGEGGFGGGNRSE